MRETAEDAFERWWRDTYAELDASSQPRALIDGFKELAKAAFVAGAQWQSARQQQDGLALRRY